LRTMYQGGGTHEATGVGNRYKHREHIEIQGFHWHQKF
jgi:hypothetical protein